MTKDNMTKNEIRDRLLQAAVNGQLDQVPAELLTQENMTLKGRFSWTPLHNAAGALDQVPKELLTQENMTLGIGGTTPLLIAAYRGCLKQVPDELLTQKNMTEGRERKYASLRCYKGPLDQVPVGFLTQEN